MTKERRRITIKDVAEACGVVPSTVSNALRGKAYVAPQTRRAIEQAAARLGYRVSPIARALRTQRSFSVGVLVADIANPTFPEIVRGIEDVLRAAGSTLLLCNTDGSVVRQADSMRALQDRMVDGLILVSQHLGAPEIDAMLAVAPPTVLIHRRHRGRVRDYVGLDNAGGITLALRHLRDLGHRRIAFMCGPPDSTAVAERVSAYRSFVRKQGLDSDPRLTVQADYTRESGYVACKALLALEERPTAIMASNDVAALGVLEAARSLGVQVPGDLSVVGFDDIFLSGLDAIALTTIVQPKHEIGAAAAELLLRRISSGKRTYRPEEILFPTELVVRRTTAPPMPGALRRVARDAPRKPASALANVS